MWDTIILGTCSLFLFSLTLTLIAEHNRPSSLSSILLRYKYKIAIANGTNEMNETKSSKDRLDWNRPHAHTTVHFVMVHADIHSLFSAFIYGYIFSQIVFSISRRMSKMCGVCVCVCALARAVDCVHIISTLKSNLFCNPSKYCAFHGKFSIMCIMFARDVFMHVQPSKSFGSSRQAQLNRHFKCVKFFTKSHIQSFYSHSLALPKKKPIFGFEVCGSFVSRSIHAKMR